MIVIGCVTAVVVVGYVVGLAHLLRRERQSVLLILLTICALALTLRIVQATEFPPGLNEDEIHTLAIAMRAHDAGRLLDFGIEGPLLLNVLFQAPLFPWVGSERWAVRLYPVITGVLSVAAAFAAARGLRLTTTASLIAAALVAVLPWSLLYGRVGFGAEMTFHQLLLLAALARLIWRDGSWPEVLIGGLGLCLLCYDYSCGMSMLGMPILAALLAPRGRRLLCLAVFVLAFLGWAPYLNATLDMWANLLIDKVPSGYNSDPVATFGVKLVSNFDALIAPTARDGWMAIRSAAMHPPVVLVAAAIGLLAGRRTAFLLGGFLGGMLPSVLSEGESPSSHRMLMMFPFIALAASCAFDFLRRAPRFRMMLAGAFVSVAALQSVPFYFSPTFWPSDSRGIFNPQNTRVIETLPMPPRPRLIVSPDLRLFYAPRARVEDNHAFLTARNWIPPANGEVIYAFGDKAEKLGDFYQRILGSDRVRIFGRAFNATFDQRDWSWLQRYGWSYEARCRDDVRRAQVPVLYRFTSLFPRQYCVEAVRSSWRGRWLGPAGQLRLRAIGRTEVWIDGRPTGAAASREAFADFKVVTGSRIEIVGATAGGDTALLYLAPSGERYPDWEWVEPDARGDQPR